MKRVSHTFSITLVALLAAVLSFSTLGQPQKERQPLFPMEGTDPLQLLMFEQIQNELKLNTDQIDKLAQLNKQFQKNMCERDAAFNKPPHEYRSNGGALHLATEILAEEARAQIMHVLNGYQRDRYRELLLQIYGWTALMDPDVIRAMEAVLDITPEQNRALVLLREQNQKHGPFHAPQEHRDNIAINHDYRKQIMEESGAKVARILSPKQRHLLKRLEGETFEFEEPPAGPHFNSHMACDHEELPFDNR